jgi:hypothetical protein
MEDIMRSRLAVGLTLLLALSPVSAAWAACTQGNLAGSWQAYAGGVDGFNDPFWIRCKLVIASNGNLAANKQCVNSFGEPNLVTTSNGKLTVNSNCIVTGTVRISGQTSTVTHGTLDPSKNFVSGVGFEPTGGAFIFNAVRQ